MKKKYIIKKIAFSLLVIISWTGVHSTPSPAETTAIQENEYLDMDISQLMQITITSVAKKPQTLSDAAAAVFVITQDDIHRSGVTSIPEALRMVPGLQVARIGADKWAISSRGFNGQTANKLLVLMDGRTLYSPTFSGVYWDVQDTMLEDIDRIEVIRGPGGTIWGANAVNGIINIISKKASATQGGLIRVAAGNVDQFAGSMRYGTEISSLAHARAYFSYRDHDSFSLHNSDGDANDDWSNVRGGFRVDGETTGKDTWTLQGDIYAQDSNQIITPYFTLEPPFISEATDSYHPFGWNLLARWQHQLSPDNSWTLQSYYDYTRRKELYTGQTHKIFDLDFQHQLKIDTRNELIWGLAFRNTKGDFDNTYQVSFDPDNFSHQLFSGFIQDEIMLMANRIWLTLGTKLEHNEYTGFEIQPSGRLLYKATDRQTVWGAVSRAVRTPAYIEQHGNMAGVDMSPYGMSYSYLLGDEDFTSEEVLAYELGYRFLPGKQLSIDAALFYNDYDKLRTSSPYYVTPAAKFKQFSNTSEGSSYGFELAVDWQARQWLMLQFGYTYLQLDLDIVYDYVTPDVAAVYEDSSPHHQVSLRSVIDMGEDWQLNLWLRYVDEYAASGYIALSEDLQIDDYLAFDANISWKPAENMEVMLVGQNLFSSDRLEFVSEILAPVAEIETSVYGKVIFHF